MTISRNQADPNPSGGYRDQILHANTRRDNQGHLALLRAFSHALDVQDARGMKAPSVQAVTAESDHGSCPRCGSGLYNDLVCTKCHHILPERPATPPPADRGHGECCCSECETGWAAAWAEWVGR